MSWAYQIAGGATNGPAGPATLVQPGAGHVTVTGYAPGIVQGAPIVVAPATGSVLVIGYAPMVLQDTASGRRPRRPARMLGRRLGL